MKLPCELFIDFEFSEKCDFPPVPSAILITLISCYTILVSSGLKNVTITLDPEVARWARLEAARRETSVSRLLGELLKRRMLEEDDYESASRRALARKPLGKSEGRYLSREKAHERSRLR